MTYEACYFFRSKITSGFSSREIGRMYISNRIKVRFPGVVSRDGLICLTGWSGQIIPFLCELLLIKIIVSLRVESGLRSHSLLVRGFPLFPTFLNIACRICRTHRQRLGNH